jgi:hypothetical protein
MAAAIGHLARAVPEPEAAEDLLALADVVSRPIAGGSRVVAFPPPTAVLTGVCP